MPDFKQRYSPGIPFTKYLTHPLGSHKFPITEGYIYTKSERSIHRFFFHKGIDYESEYGTPVYAAASGYAVGSYHRGVITHNDGTPLIYEGQPVTMGMGYFVQIFHPRKVCGVQNGRITQYGHLSKFAPSIRYKKMHRQEVNLTEKISTINARRRSQRKDTRQIGRLISQTHNWSLQIPWMNYRYGYNYHKDLRKRESYFYTLEELERLHKAGDKYVTWVEQGELIGFAGTSGIFGGESPYDEDMRIPDVPQFATWDEVHLHFEEAGRDPLKMTKTQNRDPYAIYKTARWYKDIDLGKTLFFS